MAEKVSLIVPVYNEASHLADFLAKLDAIELAVPKELVIVDDCSTDGSGKILADYPFKSEVQRIRQPRNGGKGAAITTGIAKASGTIIGVQDADFEYDLADIPSLLVPLLEKKADVVYGSRFKKSALQVHRTYHYLVNRVLTTLSNFASGLFLTDMETCYKFARAEVLKNLRLESTRFGIEPEITAKIAKLHVRVMELPINYYPRTYLEGKKITWKDGVAALWHIFRFNFLVKPEESFSEGMPQSFRLSARRWL